MKWTIRLEFTPDGNAPRSIDVGTITRPPSDLLPEDVGLTLEEGRQLLQGIEREVIGNQVHAYAACNRRCVAAGNARESRMYAPSASRRFSAPTVCEATAV
jgi:hypothetical protein